MLDFTGAKYSDSARRGCWRSAECDGKTAYPSKAAALKRIRYQEKQRGFHRKGGGAGKKCIMTPYHCPHCKSWHVGGTDKVLYRRRGK